VGVEDWHEGSLYFSCYPRSDRPMPMSVGVFSSDPVCRDGVLQRRASVSPKLEEDSERGNSAFALLLDCR